MAAPKGHPRWGGRQPGTPNKLTTAAREAIQLTFDNLGGVPALTEWAKENQDIFYSRVWPRILPLQVAGDPDSDPLVVNIIQVSQDAHPV